MRNRLLTALAVVTVSLLTACGKDTFRVDEPAAAIEVTTTATSPPETAPVAAPAPDLSAAYTYAAALQQAELKSFYDAIVARDIQTYFGALRAAQYQAPSAVVSPPRATFTAPAPAPQRSASQPKVVASGSASGGFLACVRQRESRGNPTAVNPSSGAGGLYQFLPSTWRAMGGTGLPQNASPATQDAMAAKLYSTAGAAPWGGSC